MRLDLASVLVQWATGGLLGLWVTARHRVVGVGYGWLLRSVFGVLGVGAVAAGIADADHGTGATLRDAGAIALVAVTATALLVSVLRRREPSSIPLWPDLVAAGAGVVALVGAADAVGGDFALACARLVVGAVFLGFVTDSMLLGHWYLVQPGLSRAPLHEIIRLSALAWPLDVALLLVPPGMISVLDGTIDDGYGGLLGWTWVVSAGTTIVLLLVALRALREPAYSAVMSTTGLLYLAILTAFGTDVLARALLAS
ncbi:MAG TPA: hypothetical protein VIH82_01315 [Acidimicrobiia bacterium]